MKMPPNRGRQKDGARQKIQAAKLRARRFLAKSNLPIWPPLAVGDMRIGFQRKTIAHRCRPVLRGLLQNSQKACDIVHRRIQLYISLHAKGLLCQKSRFWQLDF